jgi:hypothetical protein
MGIVGRMGGGVVAVLATSGVTGDAVWMSTAGEAVRVTD